MSIIFRNQHDVCVAAIEQKRPTASSQLAMSRARGARSCLRINNTMIDDYSLCLFGVIVCHCVLTVRATRETYADTILWHKQRKTNRGSSTIDTCWKCFINNELNDTSSNTDRSLSHHIYIYISTLPCTECVNTHIPSQREQTISKLIYYYWKYY